MAEEPDAAESSTDDDPDEDTPSDGDSVDSEVEPTVEPEVDPETTTGDADGADESDTDADGADERDTDADGADERDTDADGPDDPIGAVTDASSPPAKSAPGVAAAGEATDAETDDDDSEEREGAGVDPAEVNHAVPTEAMDEGGLQPAEGSQRSPETDGEASAGADATEEADASADDATEEADASADDATEEADASAETDDEGTAATADAGITGEPVSPEPTPAPSPASGPSKDPEITHPEGPPDDEEMPLADHVEEMVLRLAVVCGVATVVAGTVFFFEPLAEDMIMFIWNSVIPWDSPVPDTVAGTAHPVHFVGESTVSSNPRVYGPLELKLSELKFASLVGFVLALPVFVYETYRFMRPGLYPHERRYYLAAVPTSLVLAFVGVSFAYFVILPAIFAYFIRYSRAAGALAFALRSTFDLILVLMGYMALVFQIPLFIMLAIMMGLVDRRWLEDKRLYFWGGFLGVSFLFVPEPTGMAPILVALTMIGLYEGTLALLRWTGN